MSCSETNLIYMIRDLYEQMKNNGAYPDYDVVLNEKEVNENCSISYIHPLNKNTIFKFLFIPNKSFSDIQRIEILGAYTDVIANYYTFKNSGDIFGIPYSNITLSEGRNGPYVKIELTPIEKIPDNYGLDFYNVDKDTKEALERLKPINEILLENKSGRHYKIIDYKTTYNRREFYAAIVPTAERVVQPVVLANKKEIILLPNLPYEERNLIDDSF